MTTQRVQRPGIAHGTVKLADCSPHPRNYRQHPAAQVQRLAASLARFGQVRSIVVQAGAPGRYLVVAGHGVLEAARTLGWAELVADIIPADWTAEQVEGYLVADNEHARGAEDDLAALVALLEGQQDAGNALDALGFDDDSLAALLAELEVSKGEDDARRDVDDPDGGGDDFDTTPDDGPTRCQPGDLWQLGTHRLLCGDSRKREQIQRLMGHDQANAMWTDPPYGVSYVGKTQKALTIQNDGQEGLDALLAAAFDTANAILAPGAPIYVAGPAGQQGIAFINCLNAVWALKQMLVWVKDSMVLGHSDYHYRHEMIFYTIKPGESGRYGRGGKGWYGDNAQTSVFEIPRPKRSEEHPTMKPVRLICDMLINSSTSGDIVYEPFCGSGSTLIACERLGRHCRAVEIDPHFADVILRRWEAETGRDAVLLERTASEVA